MGEFLKFTKDGQVRWANIGRISEARQLGGTLEVDVDGVGDPVRLEGDDAAAFIESLDRMSINRKQP